MYWRSLSVIKDYLNVKKYGFLCNTSRCKSSGGRPKKKVYYRDYDLDKVMDLQKKPSLILQLKDIILGQKNYSILLRDLEKEVGIVQKWNLMAVIEKYPSIFQVNGGKSGPILLKLTEKAEKIAHEEAGVRELMEPILVEKLQKLLMMSLDCRVLFEKIKFIESELGLPKDFEKNLIPKYPECFSMKSINGKDYLQLENWDPSLAITSRDEKCGFVDTFQGRKYVSKVQKVQTLSRDGNFDGPHAFELKFSESFRPNTKYLEYVQQWQKLEFPSPYLNGRSFNPISPQARKRAVAVLHEILSLTMHKRLTSSQLDAFRAEYQLPGQLLRCLVKNHGIFYITNKGVRSTVFLKEAYDGCLLIDKCPLVKFNDRFVALSGRIDMPSYSTST